MGSLTEECFQQGHLQFYGDNQWIELGEDRIEIEAVRTREGTFPEGSQWTRIPIPCCRFPEETGPEGKLTADPSLLVYGSEQDMYDWMDYANYPCPYGAQFAPPAPSLEGHWTGVNQGLVSSSGTVFCIISSFHYRHRDRVVLP